MSHSLVLLLAGPMQSWGDDSRYKSRATSSTPSKSGIVGLIAAAQGRRRTDSIEDLAQLTLAVRVDASGSLMHDYQTAQPWQKRPGDAAKLVSRYYLSDASFLVAIESEDRELLEGMAEALRKPTFPLFLGRRSCPAPVNLVQGIIDKPAAEALQSIDDWFAPKAIRSALPKEVSLPIYRDARPGEVGERRQDVPVSFNPEHRKYAWREVVYAGSVTMENPVGKESDPFFDVVVQA